MLNRTMLSVTIHNDRSLYLQTVNYEKHKDTKVVALKKVDIPHKPGANSGRISWHLKITFLEKN